MPRCELCGKENIVGRGLTRVVRTDGTRWYCASTKACKSRRPLLAEWEDIGSGWRAGSIESHSFTVEQMEQFKP